MDFFLWKLILSVQKILDLTWISFLNIYNFYLIHSFFSPREFSRIDKTSKNCKKIHLNTEISTERYLSLADFLFLNLLNKPHSWSKWSSLARTWPEYLHRNLIGALSILEHVSTEIPIIQNWLMDLVFGRDIDRFLTCFPQVAKNCSSNKKVWITIFSERNRGGFSKKKI